MNCQNLKQKYDLLLAKSEEFNHVNKVFQQMKDKTQYTHAQRREVAAQLLELQNNIQNLINTEFSHLLDYKFNETQKSLKEQYESIKNIYLNNDLITEKGIRNPFPDLIPETQEYFPFPTEQQIRTELKRPEKKEFYELKIKQGFTRIQITPIISLKQMTNTLAGVALRNKNDLFAAQKDGSNKVDRLEIDKDNPLHAWSTFTDDSDLDGQITYYPKTLQGDDSGGLTKKELLRQSVETSFAGYVIELKQEQLLIPQGYSPRIRNKGTKLNNNVLIKDILQEVQENKDYRGERILSIDSEIINEIVCMEENKIILRDCYNNDDSMCFSAGTYLKNNDLIPRFYFNSISGQFNIIAEDRPRGALIFMSAATSVRLGM